VVELHALKKRSEWVKLCPVEAAELIEQLQKENGTMAEKHAEKDLAIAEFMRIVSQLEADIKQLKQNSRLINFYKMAEENLALAQEIEWYKEMIKGGAPV
jgi:hypothetical protein